MNNKQLRPPKKSQVEFDEYCDNYTHQINEAIAFSGQSHDFFTKVKADYLTEILSNKFSSSDDEEIHALDVGCGHGLIHPYLLEKNNKLRLSGVDIAPSVIDAARSANSNVSYQTYNGTILPYADNTFHMAFAICVMHHVPPLQWHSFLLEMKRVVKLNGLVVIFEHNPLNPITLKVVKNCPLDKSAILIRSGLMKKLKRQAGLMNLKRTFILFTPFEVPILQKLDHKLGWFPLGAQYYVLSEKHHK